MNKKYLPSKNFVIALSIAVAIVLVTVVLSYSRPNKIIYDDSNNLIASSATSSKDIDSDNDRLPDWEEALYGTDPHNPDTDGDGTLDGEEVREGRDPLKANTAPKGQTPNDYVDPAIIAQDQALSTVDQGLSPTDKMAHDLMSDIIASQPVNGTMDQDTADSIVTNSLTDIPQNNYSGITKESDLNIIQPSDNGALEENIQTYGNIYYEQTQNLNQILGSDLQLINDSDLGDTTFKKKLSAIINKYQEIINNLVKSPIPAISGSEAEIYHLTIINDLEKIVAIDKDVLNTSDYVVVYSDISAYNDVENDLMENLDSMDTLLGINR